MVGDTPPAPGAAAALVTGGGTGIGRAVSVALAKRGWQVLITGRRSGPLEETCSLASGIEALPLDVTAPGSPERLVEHATDRWGRLDALVNNVGAFVSMPLKAVREDALATMVAANVVAPTMLTKAALPLLAEAGGAVVNVSSTYGHRASPRGGHYGATKAALEHLTRTWALELAADGIRVNAVAPGPTETPLLASTGLGPDAIAAIKERETKAIPLRRRGEAEEVAYWVAALCDPGASFITGQVIGVDGGLSVA